MIQTTRFQSMLLGVWGAFVYFHQKEHIIRYFDNKFSQIMVWIVIFLLLINRFHIASVVDHEILSVAALALIFGQIGIKNRLINLENSIMSKLGEVSFGIYVYHMIFILIFSLLLKDVQIIPILKYCLVYFSVTASTIITAYYSYHSYEMYFLKQKKRFY